MRLFLFLFLLLTGVWTGVWTGSGGVGLCLRLCLRRGRRCRGTFYFVWIGLDWVEEIWLSWCSVEVTEGGEVGPVLSWIRDLQ